MGVDRVRFTYGLPAHMQASVYFARNASLVMRGGFWQLAHQNVRETVIAEDGRVVSSRLLYPAVVSGAMTYSANGMLHQTILLQKVA